MTIDDQTWNDLLLDDYCTHLAPQASHFARAALRARLRHGAGDAATIAGAASATGTAAAVAGTCIPPGTAAAPASAVAHAALTTAVPTAIARVSIAPAAYVPTAAASPAGAATTAAGPVHAAATTASAIAAPSLATAASRERIEALMADEVLQAAVSTACRPLSACETDVVPHLFSTEPRAAADPGPAPAPPPAPPAPATAPVPAPVSAPVPPPPHWAQHIWLLPALFLLSAILGILWWPLWLVTLATWLLLVALQISFHSRIQIWQAAVRSLQAMLHAHVSLAAIPSPQLRDLTKQAASASRLRRQLARNPLARMAIASEYLDWVLLDNLRHYFRTQRLVIDHIAILRESYTHIAAIDADLALAAHLQGTGQFCWATQSGAHVRAIHLQNVVHPLIEQPQPLTIDTSRGAFISGQNGIGKSTLLRTIGINLLAARAFGFCYAEQASVPLSPVCASMKSEDALHHGESLYLAELRRAREMLALAGSGQRTVFLIDEIFRGTNHLESVSAGAAVLHALAEQDIVLVSSHNLALGALLSDRLDTFCVTAVEEAMAKGEGSGGRRTLRLTPGILRQTNGIALLRNGGFAPAIEAHAQAVYAQMAGQLSQPAPGDSVRAPVPCDV